MYKGIPASPGTVIGQAYVINKSAEIAKENIAPETDAEIQRLRKLLKTKIDIMSIKERFMISKFRSGYFNAYLMLLKTRCLPKSETIIKKELVNAEYALCRYLRNTPNSSIKYQTAT